MRDFGPDMMQKRQHILGSIRRVFEKYGFQALETPAMENISTLTGKYGDEGEQLIYRVLNSGDYLHKKGNINVSQEDIDQGEKHLNTKISDKGLRYDLTVPFARFFSSNYHDLPIPFKRYQIQPVWRADRPQKGRYREFYQCDADFVGTESLLCEAEILLMINEVFNDLGVKNFTIHLNHRKVLNDLAEFAGIENHFEFFTILDKIDKIGLESVMDEYRKLNYSDNQLHTIREFLEIKGDNKSKLEELRRFSDDIKNTGVKDLEDILSLFEKSKGNLDSVKINQSLARGLGYYTGAILEVSINDVQIGSVSGGGRYDDLTGVFGLDGMSGVGFSFGVDRLYDALEQLNLFSEDLETSTEVLICHFDNNAFNKGVELLSELRSNEIRVELFPDSQKMKKQLNFANKKNIPMVIMIGDDEIKNKTFLLKDMESGEQEQLNMESLIEKLKK